MGVSATPVLRGRSHGFVPGPMSPVRWPWPCVPGRAPAAGWLDALATGVYAGLSHIVATTWSTWFPWSMSNPLTLILYHHLIIAPSRLWGNTLPNCPVHPVPAAGLWPLAQTECRGAI